MALLEVTSLSISFGGLVAVSDFNLTLQGGELVAIIGPNGAGKTTVFNMLTGLYKPTTGDIRLGGQSLVGQKPHDFTARGIARTFQNIRLFNAMTVLDNLKTALTLHLDYSLGSALVRSRAFLKAEDGIEDKAYEILKVMKLDSQAETLAKNLPYGAQRRLEIARALATEPKILLLDEPVVGMNPNEMDEIMRLIAEIRDTYKLTILLIEHHMSLVMSIAEHIKVLNFGKTIAEGAPAEIQANPLVIEAYLGHGSEQ